MPDAYDTHDGRFIIVSAKTSVANGLSAALGPVPGNKVWTILSAFITTSVGEVQTFWFTIGTGGYPFPVTLPQSFTTAPATYQYYPFLREGMEIKIFPGENITGYRGAATAGSTITLVIRYIETDLPYYAYVEPQKRIVAKKMQRAESMVSGRISEVSGGPGGTRPGGGKVGPEPY